MLTSEYRDARILFVNPCLRKKSFTKILPVGLGYVMTYFDSKGYCFELLDIDLNEYEDSYIEDFIQNNTYNFILLGSIVTHYKWIKWFVNMTKQHQPMTKIIVGNSVAGSIPKVFLSHTLADVVVIGEGEISAFETVEAILTGQTLSSVKGIAFRNEEGQIILNPVRKVGDINDLPTINWDFFEVDRYIRISAYSEASGKFGQETKTRPMPVSTARGCAFKCTFCHYVFWNDPYRHRSEGNILKEINRNIDKYGANYINFWDDLSFASAKQAERMADAILESGLKFDWSAAIRVDLFSRNKLGYEKSLQIAQKMKNSGCKAVGFSLESGNQEILEMMNKKIQAVQFIDTVRILKAVGIVCNTSVVFGYPIETRETIQQTFEMCLAAKVYPSIGFLLPLPATGMYTYAQKHGFITDEDTYLTSITERQDICLNMTNLSNEEIMAEIKEGGKSLNEMLQLNLPEGNFIRTGRYQNDKGINSDQPLPLDPEQIKRNENDFSFNYSEATFEIDSGLQQPLPVC